jgi:exodeoxyribonuclease V beta subunit
LESRVKAQGLVKRSSAQFAANVQTMPTLYIMTVHAAKGLEFDYVMLPSLGDGLYDNDESAVLSMDHTLYLDAGSEHYDVSIRTEKNESMAQALRLQYVALTRARIGAYVFLRSEADSRRDAMREHLLDVMATANEDDRMLGALDWTHGLDFLTADGSIEQRRLALQDLRPSPEALKQRSDSAEQVQKPRIDSTEQTIAGRAQPITRVPHQRLSFSTLHRIAEQSERTEESEADVDLNPLQIELEQAPHPALASLADLRGKRFGIVLHALMEREHVDTDVCAQMLEQGMDDSHEATHATLALHLNELVARIRGFQFAPNAALATLESLQTAAELSFAFNVRGLSLAKLDQCGPKFGFPPLLSGAGAAQAATMNGQLIGFIDLVFEHQGKFYVLDYKTNWLGNNLTAYAGSELLAAMEASGYHLQYLLYALALHRYLRAFLPGYQFAKHFGGVHYWFVRAFMADAEESIFVTQSNPHPAAPGLGVFALAASETYATLGEGRLSVQLLEQLESVVCAGD